MAARAELLKIPCWSGGLNILVRIVNGSKLGLALCICLIFGALACKPKPKAPGQAVANGTEVAEVEQLRAFDQNQIEHLQSCSIEPSSQQPLRRLTNREIINSLEDVFAINLSDLRNFLPSEIAADGFKSTISIGPTSSLFIDKMTELSSVVADRIVAAAQQELSGSCGDAAICLASFITEKGRLLFRRPLTKPETESYGQLFSTLQALPDNTIDAARADTLAAMLQAPAFLYLIEANRGAQAESRALDSYEIASRLALFIWGSAPDGELLKRAEQKLLLTEAGLRETVEAMLASSKASDSFIAFTEEWLSLDLLDGLERGADHFPEFSDALKESLKEEVLRNAFDIAMVEQKSMLDLNKLPFTWVDANLASLYGIEKEGDAFSRQAVAPGSERYGLLTMAGILAATSSSDETSPTGRGLFFQKKLLCTDIPPAPPDAGAFQEAAEKLGADATPKERFAVHATQASCASCHKLLDPFGLGLENYDALGRFRTHYESGVKVDPSGSFEVSAGQTAFKNVAELSEILANHSKVANCLTETIFQYGTARKPEGSNRCEIDRNHYLSAKADYRWPAMILITTLSESFRNISLSE